MIINRCLNKRCWLVLKLEAVSLGIAASLFISEAKGDATMSRYQFMLLDFEKNKVLNRRKRKAGLLDYEIKDNAGIHNFRKNNIMLISGNLKASAKIFLQRPSG